MKCIFKLLKKLVIWLIPFFVSLIAMSLPFFLFKLGFNQYLEFIKILVWPITALIILFFFKKVATFIFFSMEKFNFFGTEGVLKNVDEVILEEVNKRFLEEKQDNERKAAVERLTLEVNLKGDELNRLQTENKDTSKLAKQIFDEWKKTIEEDKIIIGNVLSENKRLKETISGLPLSDSRMPVSEDSSFMQTSLKETSEEVADASNLSL